MYPCTHISTSMNHYPLSSTYNMYPCTHISTSMNHYPLSMYISTCTHTTSMNQLSSTCTCIYINQLSHNKLYTHPSIHLTIHLANNLSSHLTVQYIVTINSPIHLNTYLANKSIYPSTIHIVTSTSRFIQYYSNPFII